MYKSLKNIIKYLSPDTDVSTSPSGGEVRSVFNASTLNVIRRRYSLLEVPRRRIHKAIAKVISICVAFVNKVMDARLPQPAGCGGKYNVGSMQCGRSMIEMLGVLAIIAVLSVGGIAGYSKAMLMWRSNIQRNLIAELLHGAIDLKLRLNHQNIPFQNITSVLDSLGYIPEGVEYRNGYIYTKEGFAVHLSYGLRTMTSLTDGHTYQQNQYTIYFVFNQRGTALNLSEEEFCNNLLQVAKEVANEVSRIDFWKMDSTSTSPNGDTGITLYLGNSLKNASIAEMRQKCKMVFTETGFAHFNICLKYD